MFWIKTISTAIFIPLVLTIIIYIKDRLILKREIIFKYQDGYNKNFFYVFHLGLAFIITFIALFGLNFTLRIFQIWESTNFILIISHLTVYIFLGIMLFLMIYFKKINKYRKIIFILFAIAFSIDFICDIYEMRGHLFFYEPENIIQGEIPKCHIGILQSLLPLIFKNKFFSQGKLFYNGIGITYVVGSVIILWLAVTLVIGRGWCSWGCFWGGWDEGFSSVLRKPVIKKRNQLLKWLPFAILIVIIITSFIFIAPAYCSWFCPFKAVSEAPKIISPITIVQTVIYGLLFLTLVIIIPILTKKRIQCAYLCPFGAFQSIIDKINVFTIRIDRDKCIKCQKCIKECPVFSITEKSLEKGSTGFTCTKCGKCIDICPKNAISFHIKGTQKTGISARIISIIARHIFIFMSFFFIGTLGGNHIIVALKRILLFIATGSFI